MPLKKILLSAFLVTAVSTGVVMAEVAASSSKAPAAAAAPSAKGAEVKSEAKAELPAFNKMVLAEIARYPTDGTHGYWWPKSGEGKYDGVTQDLYYQGVKVLSGEPQKRTFCCGLTLEVFLNAWNKYLEQNPEAAKATKLTPQEWAKFQRLWFVEKLNGPGPSVALEQYGLGRTVSMEEALPGDFVQLWRHSGSGHSVIFLDWVRDDQGKITGLRYWSTQTSTKGINETVEYFGEAGREEDKKKMVREYLYIGRVELPGAEKKS